MLQNRAGGLRLRWPLTWKSSSKDSDLQGLMLRWLEIPQVGIRYGKLLPIQPVTHTFGLSPAFSGIPDKGGYYD